MTTSYKPFNLDSAIELALKCIDANVESIKLGLALELYGEDDRFYGTSMDLAYEAGIISAEAGWFDVPDMLKGGYLEDEFLAGVNTVKQELDYENRGGRVWLTEEEGFATGWYDLPVPARRVTGTSCGYAKALPKN